MQADDEPVHVYPAGPVEDLAHVGGSRRVKAPHHECWLCFEGLCEQRAHDDMDRSGFTCKRCAKEVPRHPIAGPGEAMPCWRCGETIEAYQGAGIVPPERWDEFKKQTAPAAEATEAAATPKR